MAVEKASLPLEALSVLNDYFICNLNWLEKTIKAGIESREFHDKLAPAATASLFLASLEGGTVADANKQ